MRFELFVLLAIGTLSTAAPLRVRQDLGALTSSSGFDSDAPPAAPSSDSNSNDDSNNADSSTSTDDANNSDEGNISVAIDPNSSFNDGGASSATLASSTVTFDGANLPATATSEDSNSDAGAEEADSGDADDAVTAASTDIQPGTEGTVVEIQNPYADSTFKDGSSSLNIVSSTMSWS